MANPKYAPQQRYIYKTRHRVAVNLNKNTDLDIINHLKKKENVQGYIKVLIRADMAKNEPGPANE